MICRLKRVPSVELSSGSNVRAARKTGANCPFRLRTDARRTLRSMAYVLALASAALYGAADFVGGLATRQASAISIVVVSQAAGLVLLALALPLMPGASPSLLDLFWGAAAGVTGGVGVALLYRALAVGTMAVVAPVTAVCAVIIPVVATWMAGDVPRAITLAGIMLALVSIVLVSQQRAPLEGDGAQRHVGAGLWLAFSPASRSGSSSCRSPAHRRRPDYGRCLPHVRHRSCCLPASPRRARLAAHAAACGCRPQRAVPSIWSPTRSI